MTNQSAKEQATFDEALDAFDERLAQWARAYPLDVFPEPNFAEIEAVLQSKGFGITAVSAANMRHVVTKLNEEFDKVRAARASSLDAADLLARIERTEQGRDNLLRHLQDEDLKLRPILERHGFDPEHHTVFMLLEHLERKASPVAIPEGWQPIETAPKDGTVVATYGSYGTRRAIAAAWCDDIDPVNPDDDKHGWIGWLDADHLNSIPTPTHWRPLSLPPDDGAKGKTDYAALERTGGGNYRDRRIPGNGDGAFAGSLIAAAPPSPGAAQ
jgi:hypothetical protein